MSILKKFVKLQKRRGGVFWKNRLLKASKFAEVEPHDKCLPWNH